MASLPPVLVHIFKIPLPYRPTLALQQKIHQLQLERRRAGAVHPDVLLLLEHRPTYTGGRRQNAHDLSVEEARLNGLGADWVPTDRGGETTFHGPGQIVGYPLLDLGRTKTTVRDYVCILEKLMQKQVAAHGLSHVKAEHTGLFMSPTRKLGSIGVQVRHRLTSHGFAFNVTEEPLLWFDQVVACGLADVKATSVQKELGTPQTVAEEMQRVKATFSNLSKRDLVDLIKAGDDQLTESILELEDIALAAREWPKQPLLR